MVGALNRTYASLRAKQQSLGDFTLLASARAAAAAGPPLAQLARSDAADDVSCPAKAGGRLTSPKPVLKPRVEATFLK